VSEVKSTIIPQCKGCGTDEPAILSEDMGLTTETVYLAIPRFADPEEMYSVESEAGLSWGITCPNCGHMSELKVVGSILGKFAHPLWCADGECVSRAGMRLHSVFRYQKDTSTRDHLVFNLVCADQACMTFNSFTVIGRIAKPDGLGIILPYIALDKVAKRAVSM
jgi:hypothetical protein